VGSYEVLVPAWQGATNGSIPSGAYESFGAEAPGPGQLFGPILYVCRATYNGGVHPGKIRQEFGGCNIGWGGKEVTVNAYDVLLSGIPFDFPPTTGFIVGGREQSGEPLYICHAAYNGGLHPGKFRQEFGGCNIGWGGKEVTVPGFGGLGLHWSKQPDLSFRAGNEQGGEPLYVCRARYQGGLQPGKFRGGFRWLQHWLGR
jgi:hypothetical protein